MLSDLDHVLRVRDGAQLIRSEAEVRAQLAIMASAITARFADRNPLIVAVMQGGAFTAVHLCEHFDFPYEFDYVHVSRYGNETEGGQLKWHMRPQRELAGRSVLLVDDVLDRGITLRELCAAFDVERPRELAIAVLVDKRLESPVSRPAPDFVGFECDDVFLFGCGMDYKGYWRGLPALYALGSE